VNNVTLTFDDFVPDLLPDFDAFTTGSYRPSDYDGGDGDAFPAPAPAGPYGSSLSALSGSNPNGRWSLYVFDDTPGDSGRISGWGLTLETSDPVDATADLALSATAEPNPVYAGSNIVYTVTVANQGPDDANGVLLTSQLPAGAIFVSADSGLGGCANSGSEVTCDLGVLANQDQVVVTIEATLTKSGGATNNLTVTAQEIDPNYGNNSTVVTNSVTRAADLGVIAAPAPNPAIANQNLVLFLSVTNAGPDRALGVIVTNRLPVGVPVVSISPSQGTVTTNGNVVVWSASTISNASAATLTLTLRPTISGVISNWAQVKANSPDDLALSNNSSAVVLSVNDGPIVIAPAGTVLLSESALPHSGGIDPGETVSVSFALRNIGISNATDLTATLLSSAGVSSPSGPQNYGPVVVNGPSVARTFSFTAVGSSGGSISANFDLADGGTPIGHVSFPFVLGGSRSFSNLNQITIRDNAAALPYPSTITVSGLTGVVGNVRVTLANLTHDFPDDLDILLVAPNGRNVLLMSDACGPVQVANVNVTFDQSGPPLPDSDPLVSGVFRPTDYPPADTFQPPAPSGSYGTNLSALNGINPNGTWSLYIRDDDLGDSGQLGGWSVNITTVGQLSLPPGISDVRLNNGQIQFTITGQPGDSVTIENSSDFATWMEADSRVLGASGSMVFNSPANADHLFYRVRRTQ
jgi:uncharacterized repeat protein (TIGR01451 family)